MAKSYAVYLIVVCGVVRYVGISADVEQRARVHARSKFRGIRFSVRVLKNSLARRDAIRLETKTIAAIKDKNPTQLWSCRSQAECGLLGSEIMWAKPGMKKSRQKSQRKAMLFAMQDPKKSRNIKRGLAAGRESEVHLKLWQDPAYRAARKASHDKAMKKRRGIKRPPVSEETREKCRISALRRWSENRIE